MLCPVQTECVAQAKGIQDSLPTKAPKKDKPQKHGYFYWITNDKGDVLLEKREEKGMLGGMLGLPTSEWVETDMKANHLKLAENPEVIQKAVVRHSFTHFDLELQGCRISFSGKKPAHHIWVSAKDVSNAGLPTLFKKALKLMS